MSGTWQPIETAPKDGTAILVCENVSDPEFLWLYVTSWDDHRGNQGENFWWTQHPDGQPLERHFKPTHWMPLPEPPKE